MFLKLSFSSFLYHQTCRKSILRFLLILCFFPAETTTSVQDHQRLAGCHNKWLIFQLLFFLSSLNIQSYIQSFLKMSFLGSHHISISVFTPPVLPSVPWMSLHRCEDPLWILFLFHQYGFMVFVQVTMQRVQQSYKQIRFSPCFQEASGGRQVHQ